MERRSFLEIFGVPKFLKEKLLRAVEGNVIPLINTNFHLLLSLNLVLKYVSPNQLLFFFQCQF